MGMNILIFPSFLKDHFAGYIELLVDSIFFSSFNVIDCLVAFIVCNEKLFLHLIKDELYMLRHILLAAFISLFDSVIFFNFLN